MAELEVRVDATAIEAALKQLNPQKAYTVLVRWYDEAAVYVRGVMRAQAPAIVRGRVKIKKDGFRPPRYVLIGSTHPLAHIFEGGTGTRGASGFRHAGRHFPRVTGRGGLMETTGLPRPQAFAMAAAIAGQGGLSPQPFVRPTLGLTQGAIVQMAERIANEELAK